MLTALIGFLMNLFRASDALVTPGVGCYNQVTTGTSAGNPRKDVRYRDTIMRAPPSYSIRFSCTKDLPPPGLGNLFRGCEVLRNRGDHGNRRALRMLVFELFPDLEGPQHPINYFP